MKTGFVTLVGAGCGRGLITLKGLEAVRSADVILYDDLIDDSLLREAKPSAEALYVGKRSGRHSMKQTEINALLVQKAREGGHVVRLKGGDSFVFGRGGEEALALDEHGIGYELIPGISSSIAVPEHVGIPVTHRMDARSFTVVTGHTADGEGEQFAALAKLDGTLVFLMGLRSAGHIADELMRFGKKGDTPAAVISRGYAADEKRYNCTLATLEETAKKAETPAILVIGRTAAFSLTGRGAGEHKPLRVAVTGSPSFVPKVRHALRMHGLESTEYRCLSIHPRPDAIPEQLSAYSWLVFTSANGIAIFFEELKRRKTDLRSLSRVRFAVIGQGSADALAAHGIYADFMPSEYISDVFGREFAAHLKENGDNGKLLLLRAKESAKELTDELTKAGFSYEEAAVYETEETEGNDFDADNDYITFASRSGVRAFFRHHTLPEHMVPVCIGASTEEELRTYCDVPCVTAKEHTAEGLCEAILQHAAEHRCS